MHSSTLHKAPKKDAPLSTTVSEPIDPRRDSESASSHHTSQHPSPAADELNHVPGTTQAAATTATTAAQRSTGVALQSHFGTQVTHTQHISGEPNANMHSQGNVSAQPRLPKIFSPQLRTSVSGPLSPTPAAKGKGVGNNMYTPLRLDSQLLASPWPGQPSWPANSTAPSPTRGGNNSANAAHSSSYWNATSSPVPYPCGSPTAYNSALRNASPSMQSLRLHHHQQQQQMHGIDGCSPMQLSISALGHDSSATGTSSGFASPGAPGMVHSAILDAPLQVALIPPPLVDEFPYFSFGNSIMQSTPYTPTIQTPTARGHSIYHDAMVELSQHRQELDNPLSLFQPPSSRGSGHDVAQTSLASAGVLSTNSTPLLPTGGDQLHQAASTAAEEEGEAAQATSPPTFTASRAPAPPRITGGTFGDLAKLSQRSPPSPQLLEPLTARPNPQSDDDKRDEVSAPRHMPVELANDGGSRSSHNSTPEAPPSAAEDTVISPTTAVGDEDAPQGVGELEQTKRPHETDSNDSGPDDVSSETELNKVAAVSLSDANYVYNQTHPKTDEMTPLGQGNTGVALQIATPQTLYSRRHSGLPNTPGVAPPSAGFAGVPPVPELRFFMPSPVDESGQGFNPQPGSVVRPTPSDHSASQLSLVPSFGAWQASPMLFSIWQSANRSPSSHAPHVRAALDDLLEVLRLLQSDVANVYNCVSVNEHTVRHWISCTLSALLHFTVEVSHSVRLSAQETSSSNGSAAHEHASTFAQLQEEIAASAANCIGALRETVQAVEHDRDVLEPLLLTSRMARNAVTALLRRLEKPYLRNDSQPTFAAGVLKHTESVDPALASGSAGSATRVPAGRRATAATLPMPTPLTAERIEDLMSGDVLCEELSGEWRQFASDYNRKTLRYVFLSTVHELLLSASADRKEAAEAAGSGEGSQAAATASSQSGGISTLRAIESAWTEDQLKRCGAIFQHGSPKPEHVSPVRSDSAPLLDDAAAELFRAALAQNFPPYEAVKEALSSFRDGECWRSWYVVLGRMMECTFNVTEHTQLLEYVSAQFAENPSPAAAAARHAISTGHITGEVVKEALAKTEASLLGMEEQGKARRVAILQLLLRRIFVLGVVASVHRALGKDAVVSDAQLATYVQVQRKSLEEVEAQLSAEHAECATHIKCIRAFLLHFAANTQQQQQPTQAPKANTSSEGVTSSAQKQPCVVATPSTTSPDSQWNTSTVGPLVALLSGARSHSDAMERSDDASESSHGDDEDAQRRLRDALALVREVSSRVAESVTSLCVLLQSDVDMTRAKQDYYASPIKMPKPSTRALRRLQTSLVETHRAVMMCLTSLHLE